MALSNGLCGTYVRHWCNGQSPKGTDVLAKRMKQKLPLWICFVIDIFCLDLSALYKVKGLSYQQRNCCYFKNRGAINSALLHYLYQSMGKEISICQCALPSYFIAHNICESQVLSLQVAGSESGITSTSHNKDQMNLSPFGLSFHPTLLTTGNFTGHSKQSVGPRLTQSSTPHPLNPLAHLAIYDMYEYNDLIQG